MIKRAAKVSNQNIIQLKESMTPEQISYNNSILLYSNLSISEIMVVHHLHKNNGNVGQNVNGKTIHLSPIVFPTEDWRLFFRHPNYMDSQNTVGVEG